jgi:2',3'-cyclic-nucleotide 2'-phosphodiesterase (5'-nucleotidase family)
LALPFLAGLAVACGGSGETTAPGLPAGKGQCLILSTNDSEANFDGKRLGFDQVVEAWRYSEPLAIIGAERKRQAAQRQGAVLLVDAGDTLQGRYLDRNDGNRGEAARVVLGLYESAGYDVMTIGNHDFDGGPEPLAWGLRGLKRLEVVNANLDSAGTRLEGGQGRPFKTWTTRDCGDVRIGFLGLLTPQAPQLSDFGDLRFRDAADPVRGAAREAVARLREQGVHLVVVLSHLGLEEDEKLAAAVPGIDVIIGGHSHTYLRDWKKVGSTVIVQSGARFDTLGYLKVAARPGGGLDLERSSWRLGQVDDRLGPPDAEISGRLVTLRKDYPIERVVGQRKEPWELRGRFKAAYGRRVARAIWRGANTAGARVDLAMINSGGLRSNAFYAPGPVTNFEIQAIHPFRNAIVIVELSGEQLRSALEHACRSSRQGKDRGVPPSWNLLLVCDPARQYQRYRMVENRIAGIERPGEQVVRAEVAGQPLDPKRTYRLAVNSYMAKGGSGYWVLTQARRSCIDGTPFDDQGCRSSPGDVDLVEAAVKDGSMDEPLPPLPDEASGPAPGAGSPAGADKPPDESEYEE